CARRHIRRDDVCHRNVAGTMQPYPATRRDSFLVGVPGPDLDGERPVPGEAHGLVPGVGQVHVGLAWEVVALPRVLDVLCYEDINWNVAIVRTKELHVFLR